MKTNPNADAFASSTEKGLSKREYFASMAMQGLITKYNLKTPEDQQIIAQLSIELADSLITELNFRQV